MNNYERLQELQKTNIAGRIIYLVGASSSLVAFVVLGLLTGFLSSLMFLVLALYFVGLFLLNERLIRQCARTLKEHRP